MKPRTALKRYTPIMKRRRIGPAHLTVRVFRDGREACAATRAGRLEYKLRILAMVKRQKRRCCLEGIAPMCVGAIGESEATFDHEFGRGMGGGKRDDRIVLPDGTWLNGAAHATCNQWKGSRSIPYNGRTL